MSTRTRKVRAQVVLRSGAPISTGALTNPTFPQLHDSVTKSSTCVSPGPAMPPPPPRLPLLTRAERLRHLVREKVERATNALCEKRRSFLGVEGVIATPVTSTASTPEVPKKRRPTFAATHRAARLAARAGVREFRRAYRVALERWSAGERSVQFPEGTFMMRVRFGVSCGPPPLADC